MSAFSVVARDGEARAGRLTTAHGDVPTPAFMPVGTRRRSKASTPTTARPRRAILLANTYHLLFRPGEERGRRARGPAPLHGVGGADPHRQRRVPGLLAAGHDPRRRGEGVTFRSGSTVELERFTPELAVRSRRRSGRTSRCASTLPARRRAAARPRGSGSPDDALGETPAGRAAAGRQSCSASCRGRPTRTSAPLSPSSSELDFTGTQSAGWRSARSARSCSRRLLGDPAASRGEAAVLHGGRRSQDILEVVARGIDMFDCVLPTRNGAARAAP